MTDEAIVWAAAFGERYRIVERARPGEAEQFAAEFAASVVNRWREFKATSGTHAVEGQG